MEQVEWKYNSTKITTSADLSTYDEKFWLSAFLKTKGL